MDSLTEAMTAMLIYFPQSQKVEAWDPATVVIQHQGKTYLLQFKREYYRSFSFHFPAIKKKDGRNYGYAQIMSLETLNRAVSANINKLVFATPDGKMYCCEPMVFKNFVDANKTEVPHLKGEVAMPLELFHRLNPDANTTGTQFRCASEQSSDCSKKNGLKNFF